MSQNVFLFFFFFLIFAFLPVLSGQPILSDPNPASIQSFLPVPSPPATIPAFPEQSNVAGCPLDLPDELFKGIKAVCGVGKGKTHADRSGQLRRSRCCPVLAAWLYTAYSETALGISGRAPQTASYDLPLLPDDSETCVDNLQKALNNRGIELVKPNETCDVVYCYCGIRLHPLSCPEAFSISSQGKLVGDENVKRLERHCLSNSVNGYGGLGGCSKCLKSLYLSSRMKRKRSTQPSVNDDPFSGENDITVSSRKEQGKYGASKCTYVAANDTEVCSDILYPSITECMNELNGIEGVEDNHYIKACEKFRDPEWRIMFISMSAMRRRRWVENPVSYEVRSCVDVLNGIEGVEDKRIFKAIEKLPDPEWRKMFITMSAMSRRQWLESLT